MKELKKCIICWWIMDKRKNESWKRYNWKQYHQECYRKSEKVKTKTGKIIKCKQCWKEVYKQKSHIEKSKNLFCCMKCNNEYQKKNKIEYTCKICWEKFYWSKSREKQANPTYCSMICRNKDTEKMLQNSIKWNLTQLNKKWLNKLELKWRKILQDIWVEFEEQVIMFNKFCVDVYIKSKNIVIQWDWEYWHNKPKRKQLDKSQDAYMKKCWVKVLRFTDKEIYNLTNKVYENIKRAI